MGEMFVCDREGVVFDLYLLGKVFGGGILFVFVVVGNIDVFGVICLGEYGLMFGGNLLVVVVGLCVVEMM